MDLDNQVLYNNDITIELSQHAEEIMIDEEVNILSEMYVNSNLGLELAFIDISSGEQLCSFPGAINYTREGSVITIYGQGFIEHLYLQGE